LIWIVMAIEILMLISDFFEYQLLSNASAGLTISPESATANDTRQLILAIVYLIAYITSGVTFISWFRRAYYNLHTQIYNLNYDEGWAAGAWFVPILHLFRPYQIMKELYQETENLLAERVENYQAHNHTALLGGWWALWIFVSLIGQFVFRYSIGADTIEELMVVSIASIISSVASIPLAFIAVEVIGRYAKMEAMLYNEEYTFEKEEDDSDIIDSHLT
uniref:DUF4328 domain-containing protein n=1 Tax=Haliscomenobacter sp. TaxID=2717303 RepID=UPI003364D9F2